MNEIKNINFNQKGTFFSISTNNGFKIFSSSSLKEVFDSKSK